MAHTRLNLTAWGGAALAALLLSGCTGQTPEPPVNPSQTPTATPSPTATSVAIAPLKPAAMDDDGPQGAEAAAVYFLGLDSYMQATGDTAAWAAMSHPECKFCAARLEQAQEIADASLVWVNGTTHATINHTYAQDSSTGVWPIAVTLLQDEAKVTDSTGAIVQTIPRQQAEKQVDVLRQGNSWVIVGVGDLPE